jgi:hypothetical protein
MPAIRNNIIPSGTSDLTLDFLDCTDFVPRGIVLQRFCFTETERRDSCHRFGCLVIVKVAGIISGRVAAQTDNPMHNGKPYALQAGTTKESVNVEINYFRGYSTLCANKHGKPRLYNPGPYLI